MRYIISIGSNEDRQHNMTIVHEHLDARFGTVHYSSIIETTPLGGISRPVNFLNQLACFESQLSPEEVSLQLKEIETVMGRTQEERKQEIIRIDLDLLTCDGTPLRSEQEINRPYIRQCLQQMGLNKEFTGKNINSRT